jgi:chromosome segregation ATPase
MSSTPTETDDVRHLRSDIDRLRTQIDDDRKAITVGLNEERASWRSIAKELGDISGSLRVLLEDRADFKNIIIRVFSRLDNCDSRDSMLSERIGGLESKLLATEARIGVVNQGSSTLVNRLWQLAQVVIVGVIVAVMSLVMKK